MKHEQKQDVRKELEQDAPILSGLQGKTDGMKTPPGYFDDLQDRVIENLREAGEQQSARIVSLTDRLAYYFPVRRVLSYAAAAAVVLAVVFLIRNEETQTVQLASISSEEAYAYIADNLESFDAQTLVNSLDLEGVDVISDDLKVEDDALLYDMILEDMDMEDLEYITK